VIICHACKLESAELREAVIDLSVVDAGDARVNDGDTTWTQLMRVIVRGTQRQAAG